MSARPGMTDLINDLRAMCDAGTADWTAGTIAFWSDDQLQAILDNRRIQLRFAEIEPLPDYSGGEYVYLEYRLPLKNVEGGTIALNVLDVSGGTIDPADYTFDRSRSVITFNADTEGVTRFVNANSYQLEKSAADVWRKKAAHYAVAYDFSTDNHNLRRSQLIAQCFQMAELYDRQAGPSSIALERDDTQGDGPVSRPR